MSIYHPVRQSASGNTTTEYILIAFLILIVSVGTWMTIGQGLNGMATKLKTEFKERGDLAAAKRSALSKMPTGPMGTNLNGGVRATNGAFMDCNFEERTCLVKPPPPFTAGGNGNDILATLQNMMIGIMQMLGMDVQSDPNALLTRMAQNGYKAAFLEKVIKSLKDYTAEDVERLKDTTISIEGKSYTVQELVNILKDVKQQVVNDKNNVESTDLPDETKAEASKNADIIDESTTNTANDMEETLNNPPPPQDTDASTNTSGGTDTTTNDPNLPPPSTDSTSGNPTEPGTGEGNDVANASESGTGSGNGGSGSSNIHGGGSSESDTTVTEEAAKDICDLTIDPQKCTPKKDPSLKAGPTP